MDVFYKSDSERAMPTSNFIGQKVTACLTNMLTGSNVIVILPSVNSFKRRTKKGQPVLPFVLIVIFLYHQSFPRRWFYNTDYDILILTAPLEEWHGVFISIYGKQTPDFPSAFPLLLFSRYRTFLETGDVIVISPPGSTVWSSYWWIHLIYMCLLYNVWLMYEPIWLYALSKTLVDSFEIYLTSFWEDDVLDCELVYCVLKLHQDGLWYLCSL